jgi:hypothetical protein
MEDEIMHCARQRNRAEERNIEMSAMKKITASVLNEVWEISLLCE